MGYPIIPGDDSAKNLAKSIEGTEQSTVITPVSGQRKLYPKSDGWYEIDSTGTVRKLSGDVTGPASSTTGNVASFNGTTGKIIQDSGKLAADLVTGPASSTSNAIARFNGTGGKTIQNSVSTIDANDRLVLGPAAGFSAATSYHLMRGSVVAANTGNTATGAAYFMGGSAGALFGTNIYQANPTSTTRAVDSGTGFSYAALTPVTSATSNIFEVYGNITSQTADAATTGTSIRGMALTPSGGVEFGQSTNTSTTATLTVNGYSTGDVVATFWNRYATSNNATIQIKSNNGGVVSFGLDGNGTFNFMSNLRGINPGSMNTIGVTSGGRLGDTTVSRRALKENFEPLSSPGIFNLPLYKFRWKESGDLDIGGIADEAHIHIPEYTVYDAQGVPSGIRYDKLALGAVLAAQTLKTELDSVKARLAAIETLLGI